MILFTFKTEIDSLFGSLVTQRTIQTIDTGLVLGVLGLLFRQLLASQKGGVFAQLTGSTTHLLLVSGLEALDFALRVVVAFDASLAVGHNVVFDEGLQLWKWYRFVVVECHGLTLNGCVSFSFKGTAFLEWRKQFSMAGQFPVQL